MKFIGLSSSEPARRGWWRVVLKRDLFEILVSNPLHSWSERVEAWRKAVDSGAAAVAAVTSIASATSEATGFGSPRAVVDVHILGAERGESVGDIARRLDNLTAIIDVLSIEAINNPDPIARDAALQQAEKESDPLGLKGLGGIIETTLKIAAVLAIAYVVALIVRESKK